MKSCLTKDPSGHGSVYKEVRFSPTVTPSHSVVSDIPAMNPSSTLESDYLDQLRSLLEHQRANFESERARERQLWETERALLNSRISELESSLNGSRDRGAVHHNHNYHPNADNYSDAVPNNTSSQVWEGSSPAGQPTRVFHEKGKSLDESSSTSLSLDEALSPQSSRATTTTDASVPVPVPIEKLDSKLDGITLKSSALPPEVVARVMTPPSPSPSQSPSSSASQQTPPPSQKSPAEHKHTHTHILKLKLEELGPPDKNLTRDAGHTPMAAVVDATPDEGDANEVNDEEVGQPTEESDSYFPDLPEDPALKGPLSLLNEEEHDRGFLKELNQKLLDETRQAPLNPSSDNPSGQEKDVETPTQGEQEPELKFKDTTNFGTAFGESNCGNVGP